MRRRLVALVLAVTAAACGDGAPTAPEPPRTDPKIVAFPGFDIGVYPGDAAMRSWVYPASPYRWVGYYLPAPCHRDSTFVGTRTRLAAMGWGTAVLYVGQQDWRYIPDLGTGNRGPGTGAAPGDDALGSVGVQRAAPVPGLAPEALPPTPGSSRSLLPGSPWSALVSCSSTLLSGTQGDLEGQDAIAKTGREGFATGGTIFLDVEYVSRVSPELIEYVSGWVRALLADGRYQPGIYAAKSTVATLHDALVPVYGMAGRGGGPEFWVASTPGFSLYARPADVGFAYATLWQGMLDVQQQWNGVFLRIDVDLAEVQSPSSPKGQ